jgi:hypothetical protein
MKKCILLILVAQRYHDARSTEYQIRNHLCFVIAVYVTGNCCIFYKQLWFMQFSINFFWVGVCSFLLVFVYIKTVEWFLGLNPPTHFSPLHLNVTLGIMLKYSPFACALYVSSLRYHFFTSYPNTFTHSLAGFESADMLCQFLKWSSLPCSICSSHSMIILQIFLPVPLILG